MPERVGVEIGIKTQTFTIFPSNETAVIGIPPLIKLLLTKSEFFLIDVTLLRFSHSNEKLLILRDIGEN